MFVIIRHMLSKEKPEVDCFCKYISHFSINDIFWDYMDTYLEKYWTRNAFDGQLIGARNRRDYYVNMKHPFAETEVDETVEAIEAAEVLRPGNSLLRTSESSSFLNSALF